MRRETKMNGEAMQLGCNWSQKFTHLHHLCRSTLVGCSRGDGSRNEASLHRAQSGGYLCIQCGRFLQPEWHPELQIPPALRRTLGWWCHLEMLAVKKKPLSPVNPALNKYSCFSLSVASFDEAQVCFIGTRLFLCDPIEIQLQRWEADETEHRLKIEVILLPGSQLNIWQSRRPKPPLTVYRL